MSSRPGNGERWLIDVFSAIVAALLTASLWVVSGCGRSIARAYGRHGHRPVMSALAIVLGLLGALTVVLLVAGATGTALMVGMAGVVLWTGAVSVTAHIYDPRDRDASRALTEQSLGDVLGDKPWWSDEGSQSVRK